MATQKKNVVATVKPAPKKPASPSVKGVKTPAAPIGPGKVTPGQAEQLKSFNQLLTLKRLELANRVEEFFFSMDQVSSVRTSRAQFLQALADAHGVDVSKPWSISPDDLSIRYSDTV